MAKDRFKEKIWTFLALLKFISQANSQLSSLPENIRIAAMFDENEFAAPHKAAMETAISIINDDRTVLARSRLVSNTAEVPAGDSFKASNVACQMIRPGISAFLGPLSSSASHIQSLANTLHFPLLETRWDYTFIKSKYSLNVHPHPSVIGQALADLVEKLGWKSFVILYEDETSLIRLQELLKLPKTYDNIKITLRQLYPDWDDYRPLLKEIKNSGETRIVLDCDFDKIEHIFKQADEIGLINDYSNYLITSLDVERLNLNPFKYENVNITGFRIVDTNNPEVQEYLKEWKSLYKEGGGKFHPLYSENVLIYDAMRTFAKALDDLGTLRRLHMSPLNCKQQKPWQFGEQLLTYLHHVELTGLTGEIMFDLKGFRKNFKLELLEKQRDNMIVTGIWLPNVGINYTQTSAEVEGQIVEKLQNKTLRVTTAKTTPFVIAKNLDVPKEALERMSFEEKYEGYVLDLLEHLSKEVKFKHKFHMVGDGKYGSYDPNTGEWNGMIKELQDQKADMAVVDLSMTSQRQKAVAFTMPFMNTGVGILYKKKAPPAPNLFSFLSPLSHDVWVYMTTTYLATSILMFLLARITPFEWENPHPCKDDPEELETMFNLRNALWFGIGSFLCQGSDILPKLTPFEWENPHPCSTQPDELENLLTLHNCLWHNWGSIMQQGSDIAPKAISTRMVAGMWWFFTLIMISSYTANLAAFLTAAKMDVPINSAEDLAKQTKIKYGTYRYGSTNAFFKSSTIPTYQKLNSFMESAKPSVYTDGNSEGIDRVLKEDGAYAYFMEAAVIEYNVERNCDLTQIGGLLDSKGYGIALPPGSPYIRAISAGILSLQEKGILQRLKIKWWKEIKDENINCGGGENADSAQLGLPNLGGVFIVLLGGVIVSCFIAVCEFTWKKRNLAAKKDESLLKEMIDELKFAVDCTAGDSKPIAKSSSSINESQYGTIKEEDGKSITKRAESPYATFNDNYSEKK